MTTARGTLERTPEGGIVRFDRTLPFAIADVWAAITEPAQLAEWWPPFAADIAVDLRVGGSIAWIMPGTDEPMFTFEITRLEAPTLLEHTHTAPGAWFRWELDAVPEGTRLRATYAVPDPDLAVERGDIVGLHYGIDRLAALLAGHPEPADMEVFAALQAEYAASGLPEAD